MGGYNSHYVSAAYYGPTNENPIVLRDACKHNHAEIDEAIECAEKRNVFVVLFLDYRPQVEANVNAHRS